MVVRSVKEFDKYIDNKSATQATPVQKSKEYTITPLANPYQDIGGDLTYKNVKRETSQKRDHGAFSSKGSLRPMKSNFEDLASDKGGVN